MTQKKLIEVKKLSFNRARMVRTMGQAKTEFHHRAGAMVRNKARSLIRQGLGTSQPGEPPRGKTKRLKSSILFDVDESSRKPSVLIGPKILESHSPSIRSVDGPASKILEHGGKVEVREERISGGKWQRVGLRRPPMSLSAGAVTRWRRVTVKRRPYMLPALRATESRFPGLWRGIFKKG